jgi:hypothetical protein
MLNATNHGVTFINLADIKDPDDEFGRTYREVNNAKEHQFKIGDLVQLEDGARLFVVYLHRDCDGTPLYSLSHDKDDTEKISSVFANPSWSCGHLEDSLELINTDGKLESDIKSELIGILDEYLTVTDEWGGCKLASWQWGNNVVVDGIDVAAEEIMKLFNRKENHV